MSRNQPRSPVSAEAEGFLTRWARRKARARRETPSDTAACSVDEPGALAEVTAEHLRRAGLRTLFRKPEFSALDGLNEYDGDYTFYVARGDLITQDMKRHFERLTESVANEGDGDRAESCSEDSALAQRSDDPPPGPERDEG